MFNTIKKNLYFKRLQLLYSQGIVDKRIIPFNEEFYEEMNHTYISGLPVSMHIKHIKSIIPPGKCYDRSLYMFFCFEDAILVRGDNKDLELLYGKDYAGHGWIEIGDYVYDPSTMKRYDKDLYYEMYKPYNVYKASKKEYCSYSGNQKLYDDIQTTTIDDYKPNGRKRVELAVIIPAVRGLAETSGNQEFIDDLNTYLTQIQYDEEQVYNELNNKVNAVMASSIKHNK